MMEALVKQDASSAQNTRCPRLLVVLVVLVFLVVLVPARRYEARSLTLAE